MIDFVVQTLRDNPELAIFLTLGIGYWIGNLTFGSFSLGTVTGTLLAGILVGQLDITISPLVKSVFFMLFLFAVGYGVGPQFVRGVARDGVPQMIFAVVVCLLVLGSVYLASMIAGYGPGFAAGLHAGSQTISASIGLATDAINGLDIGAAEKKEMLNQIPVAYAVAYIWGTVGTGWILATLGPKILRVDIKEACRRYEEQMGAVGGAEEAQSAWRTIEMRAYRVREDGVAVGKTVAEAELLPRQVAGADPAKSRVFVERIRRDGNIIKFDAETAIQAGDVIAISGRRETIVELFKDGDEVEDRELLDVPAESVDVVITRKDFDGKTLRELAMESFTRGVYLKKITRGAVAVEIPVLPESKVYRGDILTLIGTRMNIDAATAALGYADRPTDVTDMIWVGFGIAIGGLIGALELNVRSVPITLSTSGGALIAGLLIGWLRSVHPTFGRVPTPSLWFMNSVGLNLFIAVVGISSGPTFVAGLKEAGISLFFWGIFATSLPMLLAPLIGKYIFKFDPAINLGCCGGARTSTASVGMVEEVADSKVPMLGYTVPYAVSNTLLTLWGMVIVLLVA
jgi:putative transport protein